MTRRDRSSSLCFPRNLRIRQTIKPTPTNRLLSRMPGLPGCKPTRPCRPGRALTRKLPMTPRTPFLPMDKPPPRPIPLSLRKREKLERFSIREENTTKPLPVRLRTIFSPTKENLWWSPSLCQMVCLPRPREASPISSTLPRAHRSTTKESFIRPPPTSDPQMSRSVSLMPKPTRFPLPAVMPMGRFSSTTTISIKRPKQSPRALILVVPKLQSTSLVDLFRSELNFQRSRKRLL